MPHRMSTDAAAVASAWTATLAPALSDQDWARAIGPYGGLFVSLVMLIFFVVHAVRRQRKDDLREKTLIAQREAESLASENRFKLEMEDRERRHNEQLKFQERQQDRVMELVAECVKSNARVCQAIDAVSKSNEIVHIRLGDLTDAVNSCPNIKRQ